MPGYAFDYEPYPTVAPRGAPGNDFLRVDARPGAFGGRVAQAVEGFGKDVEHAGDVAFQAEFSKERLDSQTNVAQQNTHFNNQAGDLTESYLETKGLDAKNGLQKYKNDLNSLYEETRGQTRNPYEQSLLDRETRSQMDRFYALGSHHAATQSDAWERTTAKEGAESYGSTAALFASRSTEPNLARDYNVSTNLFQSDQESRNHWTREGLSGPAFDQKIAENRGKNVQHIVESMVSDGTPASVKRAIDFYHSQEDKMDAASRVQVDRFLRVPASKFDGRRIADTYLERPYGLPPGYSSRVFQIESNNNPNAVTGSNRGLGQFGPREEAKYGITDANRTDVGAQTRALGKENEENRDQLFRVLGREPRGSEYYLAHQQGLGGAVMQLGHPDRPAWENMAATGEGRQKGDDWARRAIWGNMTPAMKAQFPGGVNTVTGGDFVRLWTERFYSGGAPAANDVVPASVGGNNVVPLNRGAAVAAIQADQLPDKAKVMAQIRDDPYLIDHPQAQQEAFAHATKMYEVEHGQAADEERARKLEEQARKQANDGAEDAILRNIWSDHPTVTQMDIVNNKALTPQGIERMISQLNTAAQGRGMDKTLGPGFLEVFRAIHADPGDPGRITDPNKLVPLVGKQLTLPGYERAVKMIQERGTPEGDAEAQMKKQFFEHVAKPQITFENEELKIPDPKGQDRYLKFQAAAFAAYDEGKKAGKTPQQLLNPESPDYIGKLIDRFKPTPAQAFADKVQDQPPGFFSSVASAIGHVFSSAPPAPPFDASKIGAYADLKAAVDAGKITGAEANRIGRERGWITAAPAAGPQVPVSQ